MDDPRPNAAALWFRVRTGVAVVAVAGCASGGESPPGSDEARDIAALERAFWHCDFVGTTRGVLSAPMAACQYATDELKSRKFGGSFRAMLAWWEENKAAEHARLSRAQDSRATPPAAER
jgi:hypothetical protein